jgi:hypothetical protein
MEEYEDLIDLGDNPEPIQDEIEPQVSLFDLIKDISEHGSYIDNFYKEHRELPPQYNAYMVQRIFAEHMDTILLVNELNKYWELPDEMQWRFLKNTIYKKKRFGYTKKMPVDTTPIQLLAQYFHCSEKEMQKNIHVLSKEKIDEILQEIEPERFKSRNRKNKNAS